MMNEIQLIFGYFIINSFLAGYYLSDVYRYQDKIFSKLVCIAICFFHLSLAIPYNILWFIWMLLSELWKLIDNTFQVQFFFNYHFTKKYDNLEIHQLSTINRVTKNRFNSKSLSNRIYRYGTTLINKRNSFVYDEKS